jgi:2-polyprenyl-6-methoxyphenol hydroxylase-like FAD-dependent oxidoreductase
VTVVERTPELRKGLGGHAVDLFGPTVDVAEWMGILPDVLAARTRTKLLSFERPRKPALAVDFTKLVAGISDRHVEVMRGELASIIYEATKGDGEYRFGDSITTLDDTGDGVRVEFEQAQPRTFDWWSGPTACTRTSGDSLSGTRHSFVTTSADTSQSSRCPTNLT